LKHFGCSSLLALLLLAAPVGAQGFPEPVPDRVEVADVLAAAAMPVVPLPAAGTVTATAAAAEPVLAALAPLAYPLAQAAEQIDPWGWRYSQARGAWRMHTGVDFAAASGTPVLAALAGQVVLAEALGAYGLTVVVDHGGGVQTLYAHLQQIQTSLGAQLEQGEVLGLLGSTGRSSGPHLHFELRSRGTRSLAHDPTPYLPPLLPPPALTAAQP